MKLKNWIRRSFRNRIFATILVVTLMPLLLCDVVMMRVIVARTEHTQAQQGQDTLHALCARFDNAAALCCIILKKVSKHFWACKIVDSNYFISVSFKHLAEFCTGRARPSPFHKYLF